MEHRSYEVLEAGLDAVRGSPKDEGTVELIVRRPSVDEREALETATLDVSAGLVGDSWSALGSRHTDDGAAEVDRQLTLMNSRVAALIAGSPDRWMLAGDQFFVDLDLSAENLPAGTRLELGSAVVEVTAALHPGCAKFAARFGVDARRFVTAEVGLLNLRGVNAKVVDGGTVHTGDVVRKVSG